MSHHENRPRLLITGASGYLGHRLVPMASARADVLAVSRQAPDTRHSPTATRLQWRQADLLSDLRALATESAPQAIIHAAAINPGVDDANLGHNETMALRIAEMAATVGARLVVVSSDMVHAGRQAAYEDDCEPSPINDYGRSKAAAETAALARHDNVVCVRTSLIYGLQQVDRGTASFIARLARGEAQTLFDNVMRQPVWVDALSEGLLRLALDLSATGTLNLAGDQLISRADFALKMLRHWQQPVEAVVTGPAPEGRGIPLTIALRHDRAESLGLATPGVDQVMKGSLARS